MTQVNKPVQAEAPSEPMRAHIEQFATRAGWNKDEGEGAFEFVQRKCYHQGWQDGRREALGDVHRDTPVGEIYSHNCNSLGVVHAVVRFDGPFDPNDQHTWPAQGSKVYLAAPAERAPAPTVAEGGPPERDTTKTAEKQGLFRKFDVRRTDGSDQPGGKHHGCEYFVLDVRHDVHAPTALAAYADAVAESHPMLAADMRNRYSLAAPTAQEASKPVQVAQDSADPELTVEAFTARLARHMEIASLTAKDVSDLTGVSETTLSRLKNHGRMPDALSYAALCNMMGWHPYLKHKMAAGRVRAARASGQKGSS